MHESHPWSELERFADGIEIVHLENTKKRT